jgi:hypothetical protein
MPNGQPAQLANLRPAQPGNKLGAQSKFALTALRRCRKLSPESVNILAKLMRDETEPSAIRLRAAEIILNKALPSPKVRDDSDTTTEATGLRFLEVIFVKPGETLEAVRTANGLNGGSAGTFAVRFDHGVLKETIE